MGKVYELHDDEQPTRPRGRPKVRMTAAEHQERKRYRDAQRGMCTTCGASMVNGACALCAEERSW